MAKHAGLRTIELQVYDLLASLSHHRRLRRLLFGGENINAEGARHLASITTLEVRQRPRVCVFELFGMLHSSS